MQKKYSIIYADPPWSYRNQGNAKSKWGAAKHYPLMSLEAISSLEVADIADDNATLVLWTCFLVLKESFTVIERWGFTYKTLGFVWIKRNRRRDGFFWGMGNWTRSNSEIYQIGTTGRPQRQSVSVHQVVYKPVRAHSQKQDIVRDKIIALCGDLPKFELFAKNKNRWLGCMG